MTGKPTYNELEREIKDLEKEVLEYVRKTKELNKDCMNCTKSMR
jgi:hypothetical protein